MIIDVMKSSRNKGEFYKRIYFKLKVKEGEFIFAKTDVVPSFRNYKNWKGIMEVDNVLDGLILKADKTVDADSRPKWVGRYEPKKQEPDPQIKLL